MPTPAFTAADLAVSQEFLDEVTVALQSTGLDTPIQTILDECSGMVSDYTARYTLEDSRYRRLVRALALEKLHQLLNAVPDGIKKAADDALQELRDIRDGKFPTLLAAEDPGIPIQPARGDWGSATKIGFRI